jgi:hypothetical protein
LASAETGRILGMGFVRADDLSGFFMAQVPLKMPPGSMEITGAWMSPPIRPGG